jgi:hypothetical protein
MVYFQTKNPKMGKFFEGLAMEDVGIFMSILSILRPNGIFYGQMVYFMDKWYILWTFGKFCCKLVHFVVIL